MYWKNSNVAQMSIIQNIIVLYRSGTVNSKSFVGKVLLRIKWKFELYYTLLFELCTKLRIRSKFDLKLRIRTYFELLL